LLPDIVAARYAKGAIPPRGRVELNLPAEEVLKRAEAGTTLMIGGVAGLGSRVYSFHNNIAREINVDSEGRLNLNFALAPGDSHLVIASVSPGGATTFTRVLARGLLSPGT